jgi:hypothetical protein
VFLLAKFRLEKKILTCTKDFSLQKKPQKSSDIEYFFFKSSDFYDKFQELTKNIEGFYFFKKNFHI